MTALELKVRDRVGYVFLVDLVFTVVMMYYFDDVEFIPCLVGSWERYGCAVVASSFVGREWRLYLVIVGRVR